MKWLTLLCILAALPVASQDTGWNDSLGHRASNSDARKSVNGVGAWLVVTSDDNRKEKWETPSATVPQFTEAHTVPLGGRLRVLTFIADPGRDGDGKARLTCDFSMQKPDGSYSMQKQDVDCLSGSLQGEAKTIYLSKLIIGFVADKGDPPGEWIVRVTIKDLLKPAVIPLETRFVVE